MFEAGIQDNFALKSLIPKIHIAHKICNSSHKNSFTISTWYHVKHAQCESSDQNIITLYYPENWALKEFLGVKFMLWLIQSRKYRVVHFMMLILDIQNTFLLTSFKYDRTMPIWSGAKNQLESFFSHCRQNKSKKQSWVAKRFPVCLHRNKQMFTVGWSKQ